MLKHIYRAIFLVAIFAASLWYFGQNIKESVFHREETTVMSNATFPIVTIRNGKQNINLLHGYASNLDANLSRDAITILDDNQSLYVDIKENQSVVKKLNYELRDTFDNSLIENGSYSALDSNEDGKGTRIKINESLEQGKEYALKITVITAKSKKINFYTRVMANSTYHLDEKLDFVWQFHNAILDKSTVEQVESFIEPDRSLQNNSLSKVSIHSSLDLISFGSLKPEVISEVIPTIKEVSVDLASIMLDYYIKGYTEDGEEIYRVKEFYRVKYTPGRMYLLDYERTMEAEFQVDLMSLSQSEFKFGIANPENIPVYIDSGKKNLCFVRNGELWYYSVDSNRVVKIFSFRQKETDYIRDAYDQHEIKVLNVNVEGDVDFVVYGYMNRGLYEGRVGIVLYRYSASNNRIEELVYIPSNEPYQILKEKMGDFAYLNYNDVYYFLLNQTIYSYNIVTKGLTELATGITKDDYIFSKEKSYLAWQELDKNGYADKITIMHLESGRVDTINAEANDNIRLLGTIDNNIIYGISHNKNGYVDVNGQTIIPMHKVLIADDTCKVLKTYEKKGYYTINVSVSDNVIRLDRQKRSENGFVNASTDHILNEINQVDEPIQLVYRITEQALMQYYLTLPSGVRVDKLPKKSSSVTTIVEDDTTLRLNEPVQEEIYYVYAYGEIEGSYKRAGEAIAVADQKVGVVVNQDQQIVWARGTRSSKSFVEDIKTVYQEAGQSSFDACIKMMKSTHIGGKAKLSSVFRNQKLKDASKEIGATIVDVSGASLDEIFYYINRGIPVMAAKSNSDMVLITGYDGTNIMMIDPSSHTTSRMSYKNAQEMFQQEGNVFLSIIA